ncbi:MAG: hypothetical protein RBU25_02320 [Lentisphaeria bacterium]|jgi:hypothetical protein|nr:hypothetical protein [Lentisphaeria bacterium]
MNGKHASRIVFSCTVALALLVGWGCSRNDEKPEQAATPASQSAPEGMQYCDFKGGPEDAPVKVEAFYPGRHEDTLEAVKGLLQAFPGQVAVEIVDWRHAEGLGRRDATGLTCAGVMINGKNLFELEIDGKTTKVMFIRGLDGEWTAAELHAAVKQQLEAVAKQ